MTTTTSTMPRQCEKHGAYDANHLFGERWSSCPTCEADFEAAKRKREEEYRRRALEQQKAEYVRESGATGRFSAGFASYHATSNEQKVVLAGCRAFCEDFKNDQGGGLILIGPVGVGKTHLGAAMVLDVIERHALPARIVTARALVRQIRDTWRKDSEESESDVLRHYTWLSLLVLDEAGVGFGTDQERTQLLDVIDARYVRRRPTVVLSNLTLPELRESLGDRSYDRLREGAQTFAMNWPSYRGRAGQ